MSPPPPNHPSSDPDLDHPSSASAADALAADAPPVPPLMHDPLALDAAVLRALALATDLAMPLRTPPPPRLGSTAATPSWTRRCTSSTCVAATSRWGARRTRATSAPADCCSARGRARGRTSARTASRCASTRSGAFVVGRGLLLVAFLRQMPRAARAGKSSSIVHRCCCDCCCCRYSREVGGSLRAFVYRLTSNIVVDVLSQVGAWAFTSTTTAA